ncbi:hypothetical protein GJ496_008682 [Pomphorhynchus laevis]|nr:hypothetical protein GJ496_008682 [Pomphorhynchus laevis]
MDPNTDRFESFVLREEFERKENIRWEMNTTSTNNENFLPMDGCIERDRNDPKMITRGSRLASLIMIKHLSRAL